MFPSISLTNILKHTTLDVRDLFIHIINTIDCLPHDTHTLDATFAVSSERERKVPYPHRAYILEDTLNT